MVGGIKAVSPWLKSASEKLLMGLPTVLAPSGEERTLGAAAQWHARVVWPCHCHIIGSYLFVVIFCLALNSVSELQPGSPGILSTKVRYFGVKPTNVQRVQMGTDGHQTC